MLDTGAAESLVVPDIVDALGYSPRDAEVVTGVYSAVGKEIVAPIPRFFT